MGPFLPDSVSGQEGLFGGRSGRVRIPFFYWVVVGKVWEVKGLWEDSGEGLRLGGICEL